MHKLDIFNHFFPPAYFARMLEVAGTLGDIGKRVRSVPCLHDLDVRFRVMDQFGDYAQILSLAGPAIEVLGRGDVAIDLAKRGNDGFAALVAQHPERFRGFIAGLPWDDPDAALIEAKRAIEQLGAVGIQIYSNVAGAPIDEPRFEPLYAYMEQVGLPIWLHPLRGADMPDYKTESRSKYEIWWTFGWPYETAAALSRLVFSGIMDRYPDLKVICHHYGGMVPFAEGRVGHGWDQLGSRTTGEDLSGVLAGLKKRPIDYFRDFYADTATFGSHPAMVCGLAFFGVERSLFASDSPFDPEKGAGYIRETIAIIDRLDIADADRARIYHRNAEALLRLKPRR